MSWANRTTGRGNESGGKSAQAYPPSGILGLRTRGAPETMPLSVGVSAMANRKPKSQSRRVARFGNLDRRGIHLTVSITSSSSNERTATEGCWKLEMPSRRSLKLNGSGTKNGTSTTTQHQSKSQRQSQFACFGVRLGNISAVVGEPQGKLRRRCAHNKSANGLL